VTICTLSWLPLGSARAGLNSPCRQHLQKLLLSHEVLEGLAPVNKDHWHLFVVFLAQLWVAIDIDFAPVEVGLTLEPLQSLFDDVAKMTALARMQHYVMHGKSILELQREVWGN
jgi:hypothetical protein